jgi:hypothetical protein
MAIFELSAGVGARVWAKVRVDENGRATLHHNLSDLESKVVEVQTLYPHLNGERLICDVPEAIGSRFLMRFRNRARGVVLRLSGSIAESEFDLTDASGKLRAIQTIDGPGSGSAEPARAIPWGLRLKRVAPAA